MLYLTSRSHSFIRFRGYETAVWLRNKRSGREVQLLAALYPTVRLSPWRQVQKNIHSRVWTPRSHLICTPPRRATPPGSPQFLYWGIWASPPETDQDSCPGWLPPVPLDLVSPQEGFSPGRLIPRFKRFPATRILPITLCVFSVWYRHKAFMRKTLPIGRVY